MRIAVTIDDELLESAREYTGLMENADLIDAALKALVEREASRRLAAMGGSEPQLKRIPRRRPPLR
jgi:Arc/MetJ family transcription regulator